MSNSRIVTPGRIDRRHLLKAGAATAFAATGFAAAAPALIGRAAAAENTLYVNTWGGAWTAAEDEVYYKPFTAKTGIAIRPVTPVSLAKLKAQVQTGSYDWDCSNLDSIEFIQAAHEGLLEPIDFSVLDRNKIAPGGIVGDGVAGLAVGTPLVYRTDKFPKGGPQSWGDFWDVERFPGTRSLYNQSFTMLAYALLADGVPRDKLYPMDLDRAFHKMDAIKPHIRVWWTQGAQSEGLIDSGEVDMLPMWNARAQNLIDKGRPVQIVWNGNQNYTAYWFVAKGTPRAKLAWQFIEFISQPEMQAGFCSRLPYGPSNPKAFDFMSAAAREKAPTAPEHLAVSFQADDEWLSPRIAAIKDRWTQWIAT